MTDKELLKYYKWGFNDELDNIIRTVPKEAKRAYQLGRDHAIIGDDVKSVDYLSGTEILKKIKKK